MIEVFGNCGKIPNSFFRSTLRQIRCGSSNSKPLLYFFTQFCQDGTASGIFCPFRAIGGTTSTPSSTWQCISGFVHWQNLRVITHNKFGVPHCITACDFSPFIVYVVCSILLFCKFICKDDAVIIFVGILGRWWIRKWVVFHLCGS